MSWTYSENPASSTRDQLRFLIQDTDIQDQLLSDGELDYLLTSEGSALSAAARAAEILVARFSKEMDEKVGGVSVNFSQRAESYRKLMADLKRRIALKSAMPYAGGISQSDKDARATDDDRVQPAFTIGMDDLPQTSLDREEIGEP